MSCIFSCKFYSNINTIIIIFSINKVIIAGDISIDLLSASPNTV